VKQKTKQFYGEDPHKSNDYGRVINEFHCNRLKTYLDEDHKGKVVLGGEVKINERYVSPTIIDNPSVDSQLMKEEIFGPILITLDFDDIKSVIQFINERPKPLAIYYFGNKSNPNYEKVKRETSSGGLVLNDSIFHFASPFLPFGGVGDSGMGFVHGYLGFKELVHHKPILEKGTLNAYPFDARYPPMTEHKGKLMNMLLKNGRLTESTVRKIVGTLVIAGAGFIAYKTGHLKKATDFVSDLLKKK